ncbi:MAG: hypothetical protein LBS25_08850 [Candidatus Symbiothrix sp.]|jgi:phosphoglycerate dehydrogenase-like enzyme|nr:hypothetical protein [Candidatus Symbiothrix sp.]
MNLLLTGAFQYTDTQFALLKRLGFSIDFIPDEREKLNIKLEKYDAVVCNSLFLHNDVSRFQSVKFVQATSAGLERIPVDYLQQHQIVFHNARGVYSVPMAEWAIGKILEIYKYSYFFYEQQKSLQWTKNRNLLELQGKNALIVGLGNVGLEIAKRLFAFDVTVFGIDIQPIKSPFIHHFSLLDSLDEFLPQADILFLTLPLTKETFHLFNLRRLNQLKSTSILINISRGAILDEQALITNLQNGNIAAAALDVFEEEPLPATSPLWKMENVIVTPHNSFVSDKTNERLFNLIHSNLQNFRAKYV